MRMTTFFGHMNVLKTGAHKLSLIATLLWRCDNSPLVTVNDVMK